MKEIVRRQVKIQKITEKTHPCYDQFGLFACNFIQKGEFIGHYSGEVKKRTNLDNSLYLVPYGDKYDIDASKIGNEMRFINDYRNIANRPNVTLAKAYCQVTGMPFVAVVAICDIQSGTELVANYGKLYWDNVHKQQEV
jgi:SET domain-containing protein